MEPAYKLPKNYRIEAKFDLVKDKRAINVMKDLGTYTYLTVSIIAYSHLLITTYDNLWIMVAFLSASILAVASPSPWGLRLAGYMHLSIGSGIVWLWTKKKPPLQSQPPYFYMDTTDLYFPRKQYLIRELTPLGATTTIILILLPFVPPAVATTLLFMLAFGIAGSTVQLILASYVWFQPTEALVQNSRLITTVYVPEETAVFHPSPAKPESTLIEKQPKRAITDRPMPDNWFDIPLLKKSEKQLLLETIEDK